MQITAYGATDIGQRRERNEDAFLIDQQLQLFVVCDGIGGHAAGEIASQKTAELIAEYLRDNETALRQAHASPGGYFRIVEMAERATIDTCQRLHEMARSQPRFAGMGTTMTMLVIVDNKAVMSHVGDSRLYLFRDNQLHLLSSDHTLAHEMLQRGVLTAEELESSPFQHVLTRSVGSVEAVECEMLLFDVLPKDTFLLCSDGLSNYVGDSEELASFLRRDELSSAVQELVALANQRGGADNITAVVVRAAAGRIASQAKETRAKTEALQTTFLCEGVPYNRLIRLVEISEIRKVEKGAGILQENDSCEGMYLIVDGKAAISCGGDKQRELSSGECFCETALARKRKAKASVHALEPTTVLILPRAKFQRLTRRFPRIGRVLHTRLLEHLGKCIDDVGDTV